MRTCSQAPHRSVRRRPARLVSLLVPRLPCLIAFGVVRLLARREGDAVARVDCEKVRSRHAHFGRPGQGASATGMTAFSGAAEGEPRTTTSREGLPATGAALGRY